MDSEMLMLGVNLKLMKFLDALKRLLWFQIFLGVKMVLHLPTHRYTFKTFSWIKGVHMPSFYSIFLLASSDRNLNIYFNFRKNIEKHYNSLWSCHGNVIRNVEISKSRKLKILIIYMQLHGIKSSNQIPIILFSSIWPIHGIITGTIKSERSVSGSNSNEKVTLHSPELKNWSLTTRTV